MGKVQSCRDCTSREGEEKRNSKGEVGDEKIRVCKEVGRGCGRGEEEEEKRKRGRRQRRRSSSLVVVERRSTISLLQ